MIDVRRGAERFTTTGDGLTTRHSFSFGHHYDPANVRHGALVAHNDDLVAPGHGYDPHQHADLEIVTWVLDGSLVHEDSDGHRGVVQPGVVQRLGAGSGVRHSERNDAEGRETRFVQMWLTPDEPGLPPPTTSHRSTCRASPRSPRASPASTPRSRSGSPVPRCTSPGSHPASPCTCRRPRGCTCSSARGTVDVEGVARLDEGDAARFTDEGGADVRAVGACEVLVWQLP